MSSPHGWPILDRNASLPDVADVVGEVSSPRSFRPVPRRTVTCNLDKSLGVAPFAVMAPKREAMKSFDKSVRPLYERSVAKDKETETLATFWDTLLPKLMNGEVRVGTLEVELR